MFCGAVPPPCWGGGDRQLFGGKTLSHIMVWKWYGSVKGESPEFSNVQCCCLIDSATKQKKGKKCNEVCPASTLYQWEKPFTC